MRNGDRETKRDREREDQDRQKQAKRETHTHTDSSQREGERERERGISPHLSPVSVQAQADRESSAGRHSSIYPD